MLTHATAYQARRSVGRLEDEARTLRRRVAELEYELGTPVYLLYWYKSTCFTGTKVLEVEARTLRRRVTERE
jgi:hypothetical protein